MHGHGWFSWRGALIAVALAGLPACRKPADAVKSDLEEAGFKLTAEDWFKAARNNETTALGKFLAAGFPLDTKDAAGDAALHAAAAAGARDAADFLLDRGLQTDLRGAAGRTPLMSAVLADQPAMIRWLLKQGADPLAKDLDGFSPLLLGVREGKSGAVSELAPYDREHLDEAILLAALAGRSAVIDTLTNYGASVYARMEDGRTPLMIAAENGHADAVKLLLDLGAGRLSTDHEGRSAADLAHANGHAEVAALLAREPAATELTLESPAEIATAMDGFVDAALAGTPPASTGDAAPSAAASPSPSEPIHGKTLSAAVAPAAGPGPVPENSSPQARPRSMRMPPVIMRHYRQREVPVQVATVAEDTATLVIPGAPQNRVTVRAGDTIPGSRLRITRVQRRMQSTKDSSGPATEISVVEVSDPVTGVTREWISGLSSGAHDPVALVEDTATGLRYTATPGQRFKSADGSEFIVSDVRPNQIIIKDARGDAVETLPLRGPRG